ncbi:hypothetical protein D1B33_12775 [Lysinibacillus yapensis]|uniref:Uncharacterized protein n=1 Tax=Ureibacillus yapensis TaxID=2304605 RepID=A0A396SBS2_9BACL|nr:hypothetical protein D1B33_12775 [Lysinibacillus yapensis]
MPAPTSIGDSDKKALFAFVGRVETLEELAAGAGQQERWRRLASSIAQSTSVRKQESGEKGIYRIIR